VLLDPALAHEGCGSDARAAMIAVSREVDDDDLRIREGLLMKRSMSGPIAIAFS
jgi:hypothetical protein